MATSITPSYPGTESRAKSGATNDQGEAAWRADLRSVGFTGFEAKREQPLRVTVSPLCFLDDSVLVASFITREDVTTLARRNDPGAVLPLTLHGTLLDAASGRVREAMTWPITSPRGGVAPDGEGGFIVLTAAAITAYSRNIELVKTFQFSDEQQAHLRELSSSPTGKSVWATYHRRDQTTGELATYFQRVDPASGQPTAEMKAPTKQDGLYLYDYPPGQFSDMGALFIRRSAGPALIHSREIVLEDADGGIRALCEEKPTPNPTDLCGFPLTLSNHLVALVAAHGLRIIRDTGGETISTASLPQHEYLLGHKLYSSADAKRVAVTVWVLKGGNALLDISAHSVLKRIVVYEVRSGLPIFNLDAKRLGLKTVSGLALSPKGEKLAIFSDGIVQLFQLPTG